MCCCRCDVVSCRNSGRRPSGCRHHPECRLSYKRVTLEHKGFGMAIYSRYPIANDSILVAGYFPVMTGTINTRQVRSLICVPPLPRPPAKRASRNRKGIRLLTQMAKAAGSKPLILMGDLNAVPWSTSMEGLLEHGHLEDSRKTCRPPSKPVCLGADSDRLYPAQPRPEMPGI